MYSAIDPIITFDRDEPDMNLADQMKEAKLLGQRNRILQSVMDGREDLDTYLDCLAEQGIDPIAWLEMAAANMQYVVDSGITFQETPSGLLIPL